jgi:hypothetical protein
MADRVFLVRRQLRHRAPVADDEQRVVAEAAGPTPETADDAFAGPVAVPRSARRGDDRQRAAISRRAPRVRHSRQFLEQPLIVRFVRPRTADARVSRRVDARSSRQRVDFEPAVVGDADTA